MPSAATTAALEMAPGLWWREDGDRAATVLAGSADEQRPLVRFVAHAERMSFELAVFANRPGVDISFQPSAAVLAINEAARDVAADPNRWCRAVAARLRYTAEGWNLPRPQPEDLLPLLGSLGHPTLRTLFLNDNDPLAEIPRWARPVLEASTLADGVRRQFGADASKSLIRALAASIAVPSGPPHLAPLAFTLCGQGLLNSDQLALVASAPTPIRPPEQWPSVDDLALAHRTLPRLGADRATSILVEAMADHDPRVLFEVLALVELTRSMLAGALPGRLDALRERCASVAPRIQPPPAVVEAPIPRVARAAHGYRYAPPLSEIDGLWVDDHQLRLPHNRRELIGWSRSLDNCLDTYPDAVRNNRAWIIGVEHANTLVAAIEIDPARRRIVQFLGRANRTVPDRMRDQVVRALEANGVVRPLRRPGEAVDAT
jgi:hypothetical protein